MNYGPSCPKIGDVRRPRALPRVAGRKEKMRNERRKRERTENGGGGSDFMAGLDGVVGVKFERGVKIAVPGRHRGSGQAASPV